MKPADPRACFPHWPANLYKHLRSLNEFVRLDILRKKEIEHHLEQILSATGTTPQNIDTDRSDYGRFEDRPAPSLSPSLTSADVCSAAIPMVQDLLRPALELMDHVLNNGLSEQDARVLAARVKIMRAKRDELSDYIDLLTSYANAVDALQTGTATPNQAPDHTLRLEAANSTPCRAISWTPTSGAIRGEPGTVLHGHHEPEARPV